MKKIFNNLKISVLFALIASQEFFSKDKPEYKDVTTIKHKFDNDTETVNVFSQKFVKETAGDKATFHIDGAYGFALINQKAKAVKEVEVPPPPPDEKEKQTEKPKK